MASMLLLAISAVASGGTLPRCDLVEINHYQPAESVEFTQLIAWDWDSRYRRWNAQQWAMVKSWDRVGDVLRVRTEDGSIEVRAKLFRETLTKEDPERVNQILFEAKHRRRVW